jgi:hypothetical protein
VPIEYAPDAAWPPPEVAAALPYYREWLAWWSGDEEELHKVYAGYNRVPAPHIRPQQLNGGASGWIARKWWGNPVFGPAARRMHVPAAGDISTISRDLLFSEPPGFELDTPDIRAQELFDELVEQTQLIATLSQAAEQVSAAGGGYLRASVNLDVTPLPVTEAMLPDNAVPDFYGPFLRSVTFWRSAGPNLRHLERHEMIGGKCWIFHQLRSGSAEKLGRVIPLDEGDDECRRLAKLVGPSGGVETRATMLDVVYVPNVRPHRGLALRGSMLGRSDYSGAEGSMDALDQTLTSWMNDLALARARILVPQEYLRRPGGAGEGAVWDPERSIFQAVNAQTPDGGVLSITPIQFAIRVQEHRDTAAAHWRTITSCAGLDTSDHDTQNGPMQTATQVMDKGSRKRATRGSKIKMWTPNLQQLLWVLQELAGLTPYRVKIEWPDAAAPDAMTLAQTLQLISAAGAASTETLVAMLHPDWQEPEIKAEAAKITAATAPPEDPGSFSGGAPDGDVADETLVKPQDQVDPDAGQP